MATFIGKWDDFKKEVEKTPEFISEEIAFKIALEINKQLENVGMTKKEFAKSLGVSKPYVSQILQGENNMTILSICKIAVTLGLQPEISFNDLNVHRENKEYSSVSVCWESANNSPSIDQDIIPERKAAKSGVFDQFGNDLINSLSPSRLAEAV